MQTVNVARDFSRFPAGRYKRNGDTSGEGFRERFLETPLKSGQPITVQLDGTIGYGSSFLEEAFGGVVRSLRIKPESLRMLLKLDSSDPVLVEEIQGYIDDAAKEIA